MALSVLRPDGSTEIQPDIRIADVLVEDTIFPCHVSGCVLPKDHWGLHQGFHGHNPHNQDLIDRGYPPPRPGQYVAGR